MRPQDTFCFTGKTVDWLFSQLQNREGSATQKIKTVSKGGPPARKFNPPQRTHHPPQAEKTKPAAPSKNREGAATRKI